MKILNFPDDKRYQEILTDTLEYSRFENHMKKFLAKKLTLQKFRSYELGHI